MRKKSQILAVTLFAVYGVALVWVIMFKMQFSLTMVGSMRSVNLVPLAGAVVINGAVNYGEVVQNVLAFVPFGLFMGMLVGYRPFWCALVPIAVTSLVFEVLQFAFAMGVSDITDLIANTAGGAVGLGLYMLVRHLAKSDQRALRFCNVVALIGALLVLGFVGLLLVANV